MKKILVYSHDAYGLGNIRRMLEIIYHLVNSDPEVSVLLISGSPMVQAFRIPAHVDYLKLPCVSRSEKGENVVKSLGLSYENTIRLRAGVIMMAATDFDPDLVLVDKKPFGIDNELELALTVLSMRARRPKIVLLLRDILDAPEVTTAQWEKARYHQSIADYYDRVLIVGAPEVFDAAKAYRFPASTARKVRYCGYIRRPAPRRSAQQTRTELGLGKEPLVLVTAGGGGDGYVMMSAYLHGLEGRPGRGFKTLLISGPEMSPGQREEIFALAAKVGDVIVEEFSDDMMGCMNAADVVVAMGGYNTVCELLTLRKRFIIIPRVTPVQEQWIRAERMHELGLLRALHPDELTPQSLVGAVEEELARTNVDNAALSHFAMDGLPQIGNALSELLTAEETPAPTAVGRRGRCAPASSGFANPRKFMAAGLQAIPHARAD